MINRYSRRQPLLIAKPQRKISSFILLSETIFYLLGTNNIDCKIIHELCWHK